MAVTSGSCGAGEASRQDDVAIAAGARVDVRLDRRRRRGEDHREAAEVAAHHRHVARLVVHAVVLLEAGVVLLVDDDEAEIAERQEQRRARPDDDARLARRRLLPHAAALRARQRRVPFDRRAAEARLEAAHELIGQRDFRQHDRRLLAALQRARHRLEIDLRLAGAGDAVEQRRREVAAVDRRAQRMHRRGLLRLELGDAMVRIGQRRALVGDRHLDEVAGRDEPVDDARGALGRQRQRRLGADGPVAGNLQRPLARRRHARRLRRAFDQRHAEARLRRLEHGARAHHHAHRHAERRQRVLGDPLGKAQRQRRQRRHVEPRGDGFQLLGIDRLARLADRPTN